jgi:hypothetical protein
MKIRNTRARLCAVLFTSLFSSIAFAEVSAAPDRPSLEGTDFIYWQNQGVAVGDPLLVPQVLTNAGQTILVTKTASDLSYIDEIPSLDFLPNANFEDGDFVLDTYGPNNIRNFLSFSYEDGRDFCGLGTQIAPFELGGFEAQIQAFNDAGSMGLFSIFDSNAADVAAFIGIMSDAATPMNRVEIHIESTDLGGLASAYAINQVDLKECATEPPPPEVPAISCEGFAAPMANYPVKAKKNRVFPLKMELFDEFGIAQNDVDLLAAPVVTVTFTSGVDESAFNVSGLLSARHGSDGNLFYFTDDDIWQFNLKSKGLAAGTYVVTVDSGDATENVIDSTFETSFIIKK